MDEKKYLEKASIVNKVFQFFYNKMPSNRLTHLYAEDIFAAVELTKVVLDIPTITMKPPLTDQALERKIEDKINKSKDD